MIEYGILTPESHVELLEGRIIEMNPQRAPHAATTQRTSDYLKAQLTQQAHVRMQLPVTLSTSEPEPDIAIVIAGNREQGTGNSWKSVSVVFDSSSVYVLIALAVAIKSIRKFMAIATPVHRKYSF